MINANIKYLEPSKLKFYSKNPRIHSKEQISKIIESINEFGFLIPITIDENYLVINGQARAEAALKMGLETVPCIHYSHLSKQQKKAFRIVDNKTAELSKWDFELLHSEFKLLEECNYDLSFTGFETAEIDIIFDSHSSDPELSQSSDELDTYSRNETSVSKEGDLWLLGEHRLYCGSALEEESYKTLFGSDMADAVFTDPPYNVPVQGHVCGNGKFKHKDFLQASGEMSEEEFTSFLSCFMGASLPHLKDGALYYCCMDWRHNYELISASKSVNLKYINLCVWNKSNGGMGSLYRSKHELINVFKNGKASHTNNIKLGKHGRYRTNVWDYPGVNTQNFSDSDLSMHPTVKPLELVIDAVKDCTNRDEIILDPFMGSGTTIIAAHEAARRAYGIELDPHYIDTAIHRWQSVTGGKAIHAQSNKTFNAMENTNVRRR